MSNLQSNDITSANDVHLLSNEAIHNNATIASLSARLARRETEIRELQSENEQLRKALAGTEANNQRTLWTTNEKNQLLKLAMDSPPHGK